MTLNSMLFSLMEKVVKSIVKIADPKKANSVNTQCKIRVGVKITRRT